MNLQERLDFSAIVTGLVFSLVIAGLLAVLAGGAISAVWVGQGMTQAQIESRLNSDPGFLLVCLILSFGASFGAGFIAARRAGNDEMLNAGASGLALLVSSLIFYVPLGMGAFPLWYTLPAYLLTIPLSLLGGYVIFLKEEGK